MRILVDCDGVLAEFVPHILARIGSTTSESEARFWDLKIWLPKTEYILAQKEMQRECFWASQPAVFGAREAIERLAVNHELVCVTAPSPLWGWSDIRRDWVNRHFPGLFLTTVVTSYKYLIQGDVMIDDKPENLDDWRLAQRTGARTYLFDRPWNNRPVISHSRLYGWSRVIKTGELP